MDPNNKTDYAKDATPDLFIWAGDAAYVDRSDSFEAAFVSEDDGVMSLEYIRGQFEKARHYPYYEEM